MRSYRRHQQISTYLYFLRAHSYQAIHAIVYEIKRQQSTVCKKLHLIVNVLMNVRNIKQ